MANPLIVNALKKIKQAGAGAPNLGYNSAPLQGGNYGGVPGLTPPPQITPQAPGFGGVPGLVAPPQITPRQDAPPLNPAFQNRGLVPLPGFNRDGDMAAALMNRQDRFKSSSPQNALQALFMRRLSEGKIPFRMGGKNKRGNARVLALLMQLLGQGRGINGG